jgi:cobalt/nickel transport system permease protein
MHISEGVLSPAILTGGAALTAIGVGIGLKNIDYEEIPYMGILTAGFFLLPLYTCRLDRLLYTLY